MIQIGMTMLMTLDLARKICDTAEPFIKSTMKRLAEEEARIFYGETEMCNTLCPECAQEEGACLCKEVIKTPIPLGKRVLLVKADAAEESKGGIILPSDSREQPLEARVVAVGHEVTQVAKDDMVIFAAFAGTTFTIGDRDVIVLDEEDIMLVLREVKSDD